MKKENLYPRLGWCRDRRMPGAFWLVTTLINEFQVGKKKSDKVLVRWISARALKSNELSPVLRNHMLEVKD